MPVPSLWAALAGASSQHISIQSPRRSPSDPWIHASAWLSFAPTLSPLPNKHIFTSHLRISLKWQVKGFRVCTHMKRADAFPQFTATLWLQNNRTLSRVRILRGKAPSVCPNTPLQTLSAGAASLSRRTDRSALTLSVRERREAAQWGMLLWWAGGESERLSGSEQIWGAAEHKPLPSGWRRERTRVLGFSLVQRHNNLQIFFKLFIARVEGNKKTYNLLTGDGWGWNPLWWCWGLIK